MKRTILLALALTLTTLGFTSAAHAQVKIADTEDTKLYISLNTVGTLQTLHQTNVFDTTGKDVSKITSGMQTAFGDLGFQGKFGKKQEVEMYFDLYLASRNHPSQTYGNQGYLVLHGVPENLGSPKLLQTLFSKIDFKAGAFNLDYGDHVYHRSNNAIAQLNPLVGNYVIDPEFVAVGAEVMSKPESRLGWLLGVSNGTNTEDFAPGRGIGYNAKFWAYPVKPLRASVSLFKVDHSENNVSRATLFAGNRGGERYAAVAGGGQAPGQILPGAGKDVTAAQFDLTWDEAGGPLKLYGNYGVTRDADTNGSVAGTPEEKWNYYAAEAKYVISPALYAAIRYSAADAVTLSDRSSNGKVDRIQLGGGLWLTKNALVKVEWVDQKYSGFATGDVVNNGIQAWKDPAFKGLVSEVSFSF